LTARRVLAVFLLAGTLGAIGMGARQGGWLELFSPAPKWETAEHPPEEGPPGAWPADEIDPGDLALELKERASYPDELVALLAVPEQKRIGAQAASPDGRWLAVGVGDVVQVWRVGNAPAAVKLENHPGPVAALTFTPDSKTLLAGGGNAPGRDPGGWLQAWHLERDALVAGPSWSGPLEVYAVALAADGETLAVGGMPSMSPNGGEGPRLQLGKFRNQQFTLAEVLETGLFPIRALAFSPDGKTLASARKETVRLWNVGQPHLPHWLPWTLAALLGLALAITLAGGRPGVNRRWRLTVRWSGGLVAVGVLVCLDEGWAGLKSRKTRLWTELPSPGGPVKALAFAPDGRTLAVGGSRLSLWDVRRRRPAELPALSDMSGPVETVAFAPQGPWLIALGASGEGVVAHTGTGRVVRRGQWSSPEGDGLAVVGGRHVAVHRSGKVALLRLWSRDGSEKALAACSEALTKNPRDVGARMRRAQLHLRHGRAHRAVPDLDAAVNADSKCKEAYWLRAMLRARGEEQQGALSDLDKVIELDPKDALAHYQRGLLLVRMQHYAAAKSSLDKAFLLKPQLAKQLKDK
jgi:WD40 repeat protein